ncbi:hypothetical protein CMALT430_320005 [Carnobacterium maltaromaticum]|nr:hypothetical protein CMALT430_320005 [Carnobacterium maltaromaticum]
MFGNIRFLLFFNLKNSQISVAEEKVCLIKKLGTLEVTIINENIRDIGISINFFRLYICFFIIFKYWYFNDIYLFDFHLLLFNYINLFRITL